MLRLPEPDGDGTEHIIVAVFAEVPENLTGAGICLIDLQTNAFWVMLFRSLNL
jgi:hypothetical protein